MPYLALGKATLTILDGLRFLFLSSLSIIFKIKKGAKKISAQFFNISDYHSGILLL